MRLSPDFYIYLYVNTKGIKKHFAIRDFRRAGPGGLAGSDRQYRIWLYFVSDGTVFHDLGDRLEDNKITESVRQWVESLVVGLNLCPFAKRELVKNRVRFAVAEAKTEEQLLRALQTELELLDSDPSIETTLLIHANVLQDFYEYNQFLGDADRLLVRMRVEGVYQIAGFHPDYQFDGTGPDDVENYTNRSPYPLLHLIREASLERVIADFPDTDQIPARNIALMNSLGGDKLQALMQACFNDPGKTEQ